MESGIKHLGVIMDGNRRWAKKNMLDAWLGHEQGVKSLDILIKFCKDYNIQHISAYVFSLENTNRTQIEIDYLFKLLKREIEHILPKLLENNIKLRFIGDIEKSPEDIKLIIQDAEQKTQNNNSMLIDLLFYYGGQQEIIAATQKIAHDIKNNIISPENIDKNLFEKYLWSGDLSAPELVIRTGKVRRLSNFLLYKMAYSELYFLDKLWPEVNYEDFVIAYQDYKSRTQNFGK